MIKFSLISIMAIVLTGAWNINTIESGISKQDGMTLEEFNKRINNKNKTVLVYLNADWCIPCVKLKPVIEQITKEQAAVVEVLSIDVDKNPAISEHFEINTLPMFMIYRQGKKVWDYNANMSKEDLVAKINFYKTQ